MTLIKWIDRPTTLMDEVNHWLDSLSVDTPINFYNKSSSWVPQFEVREVDDSYQIFAELPGMNKKDISLEVVDGTLTISGEKSNSDNDKNNQLAVLSLLIRKDKREKLIIGIKSKRDKKYIIFFNFLTFFSL